MLQLKLIHLVFMGVGPYDIKSGASIKSAPTALTYTQAFTEAFEREAERDESICAISAATD